MKFLLDENFPKSAITLLTDRGHECVDFREVGPKGATDQELFAYAIQIKAVLLTTDRDFFHTIPNLYDEHPGAVVIALKQPNRKNILKKVEWFLNKYSNTDVANRIFELRDKKYISY